jgi:hypothetical protein
MIGTTINLSIKDLDNTPMSARAIPFFYSALTPFKSAIGKNSKIMAKEVIITGLKRSFTD